MPAKRQSPEQRVRAAIKTLGFTLGALKTEMNGNGGNFEGLLNVQRLRGRLRLVIRCRHPLPSSWSMSLILNSSRFDGRIDCIDWEPLFVAVDGTRCSGFHRHEWSAKEMNCDYFKLPLPSFQPSSAEEFIVQGMDLLKVIPRKEESPDVSLSLRID